MAIAKVIAGLRQHKGVIAAYDRNGFISGDHFNEFATVFVTENVAAAQQQTARQQQARLTAIVKRDFNAAFYPHVNRQGNAGRGLRRGLHPLG